MIGRISLFPTSSIASDVVAGFCFCAEVRNSNAVGINRAIEIATTNKRRNGNMRGLPSTGLVQRALILAQKCQKPDRLGGRNGIDWRASVPLAARSRFQEASETLALQSRACAPANRLLLFGFVIITTDEPRLIWFEFLIGCSGRPSCRIERQPLDSHFDCTPGGRAARALLSNPIICS